MLKRSREVYDIPSFSQEVYEYGEGSPKIMFTAGIHGDEVTGIYVAEKLIEYFNDNEPMRGSIKIMPKCNPAATRQFSRKVFYDDIDMNRIFPGAIDGSPTLKAAQNIWQESEGMDVIIDIHCCGQYSMTYILAMHDEFLGVKELSMKLNIPRLVESEGTAGQFFTESCNKRGQKALIIELPRGHSLGAINFEAAEECYEALLNLLRAEGMIKGEYIHNPPTVYGKIKDIAAKDNGLWLPQVNKGDKVKKGQVIGRLNGKEVVAYEEGVILMVVPGSYLYIDDCIIMYMQEI